MYIAWQCADGLVVYSTILINISMQILKILENYTTGLVLSAIILSLIFNLVLPE